MILWQKGPGPKTDAPLPFPLNAQIRVPVSGIWGKFYLVSDPLFRLRRNGAAVVHKVPLPVCQGHRKGDRPLCPHHRSKQIVLPLLNGKAMLPQTRGLSRERIQDA